LHGRAPRHAGSLSHADSPQVNADGASRGRERDCARCWSVVTRGGVSMIDRRCVSGALLGLLLPITGCGGGDSLPEQTSPRSTTVSSQPSQASPAETSEAPTPQDQAAEAAIQVFEGFLRISDAASRESNAKDWEPEIRRYAADPAALLTVQSVRDYATLGLRQEGTSAVDLEVTGVDLAAPEGPTVRIAGCYDSESAQTIEVETGEVVPPGTPRRYVWDIIVVQFVAEPGEPWLVRELEPQTAEPC
jgi:hypothetical protein